MHYRLKIILFCVLILVPQAATAQRSCEEVLAPARGNLQNCNAYLCGNYPVDACWALRSAANAVVYGHAGTGHCAAARDELIERSQYPSCVCERQSEDDFLELDANCYETRCPQLLDLYQREAFPVEHVMRRQCREILDEAMQSTGRKYCPNYRENLVSLFQIRAKEILQRCVVEEINNNCENTAALPTVELEVHGFTPPGIPSLPGGAPASNGLSGRAVGNPNALGKTATNFVRSLNDASTRALLHNSVQDDVQDARCKLHYFREECLYPGILIEIGYELGGASGSERAFRYSNVIGLGSCDRDTALAAASSRPRLGVGADGRQLAVEYIWVVPR